MDIRRGDPTLSAEVRPLHGTVPVRPLAGALRWIGSPRGVSHHSILGVRTAYCKWTDRFIAVPVRPFTRSTKALLSKVTSRCATRGGLTDSPEPWPPALRCVLNSIHEAS